MMRFLFINQSPSKVSASSRCFTIFKFIYLHSTCLFAVEDLLVAIIFPPLSHLFLFISCKALFNDVIIDIVGCDVIAQFFHTYVWFIGWRILSKNKKFFNAISLVCFEWFDDNKKGDFNTTSLVWLKDLY